MASLFTTITSMNLKGFLNVYVNGCVHIPPTIDSDSKQIREFVNELRHRSTSFMFWWQFRQILFMCFYVKYISSQNVIFIYNRTLYYLEILFHGGHGRFCHSFIISNFVISRTLGIAWKCAQFTASSLVNLLTVIRFLFFSV